MTSALDKGPAPQQGNMKFFLVGFMGSGKSYWGRIWAERNGLDFYDLDEVIEKKQDSTIAAIFEKYGEAHFRKLETEALRSFETAGNCIIACGGGTPCFNDNMQWMKQQGTTVYLAASPQYILERVKEEKDKRPLISQVSEAGLLFFIEQKLKEREPVYQQASMMLPVTGLHEHSLTNINH